MDKRLHINLKKETKMRYGTDCIRMKSPVYASETERYGSNETDTFESTL